MKDLHKLLQDNAVEAERDQLKTKLAAVEAENAALKAKLAAQVALFREVWQNHESLFGPRASSHYRSAVSERFSAAKEPTQ